MALTLMRSYFYALILATPGALLGDAPSVDTKHTVLRAVSDEQAREFGRRKFRFYGAPEGQTAKEIVHRLLQSKA